MLTPTEEALLRDAMTIRLLQDTSTPATLARARREEHAGLCAYDVAPDPFLGRRVLIQPRDTIGVCPRCGAWFTAYRDGHVYCSQACGQCVRARRRRQAVA